MFHYLWDHLVNLVSGFGTSKDPTTSNRWCFRLLNRMELENAYRGDWLARRIVDAPAEDMTREWRLWQAQDEEIDAIVKVEEAHQLQRKLKMALIRSRLYGGSALCIGVDDGKQPEEPLVIEDVKRNALKFVVVLNRYELNAGPRIYNVDSPWYTRPQYYTVASPMYGFAFEAGTYNMGGDDPMQKTRPEPPNQMHQVMPRGSPGMIRIHPSRVVEFAGSELPDWRLAPLGGGWGDSILQVCDEMLKDFAMISGGIAQVLNDSKIDVIKIKDFAQSLMRQDYQQRIISRFSLANLSKSLTNSLLIDKEEDWQRIQSNYSGLPNLMREAMTIACGAGGIPVSRAIGQSPGRGLSAEGTSGGEVDIRNYYDTIQADQNVDLKPRMLPLDEVLIRSALGGRPDGVDYMWNPLYKENPKEVADVAFAKAQTTQIYANIGIINEDAFREGVVSQLIADDTYPALADAIDEHGAEPEEPDLTQWAPMTGPDGKPLSGQELPGLKQQRMIPPPKKPAATTPTSDKPKATPGNGTQDALWSDAEPQPLYVCRDVLNGTQLVNWAKSQGFKTTLPAEDLHVTICYSKQPMDWLAIERDPRTGIVDETGDDAGRVTTSVMERRADEPGSIMIQPGGPRVMDRFGEAIVLCFRCKALEDRHHEFIRAGASWDHAGYTPHITITWEAPEGLDLDAVEPYKGPIRLGPEEFRKLDEDWKASIVEDYSPDQPRDPRGRWTSSGGAGRETPIRPAGRGAGGTPPPHPASRTHLGFDIARYHDLAHKLIHDETGGTAVDDIVKGAMHAAYHHGTAILHEMAEHQIKDIAKEATFIGVGSLGVAAGAGPLTAAILAAASALAVKHAIKKLGWDEESTKHLISKTARFVADHAQRAYHHVMGQETLPHLMGRAGKLIVTGHDAATDIELEAVINNLRALADYLEGGDKYSNGASNGGKNGRGTQDYDPDQPRDRLGKWSSGGGGEKAEAAGGSGAGRAGGRGGGAGLQEAQGEAAPAFQASEVETRGRTPAAQAFPKSAVEAALREARDAAGGYQPLPGLPAKVMNVNGKPFVQGPLGKAQRAAEAYMREAGLHYERPASYQKVDPERAVRIADAFDRMQHDPHDPRVRAAYDAMAKETLAQWQQIKKTGLKVDWIKPDQEPPYKSPFEAVRDIRENGHWWGFLTSQGFGSGEEAAHARQDNPLLAETDEVVGGHKMLVNDVFRVVHDYFGHLKEGVGFRADGEDNAWRSHAAMYSDLARPAMTSETRGQNSWVNYGPHALHNKDASETGTVYAPQKIGLMPTWTMEK